MNEDFCGGVLFGEVFWECGYGLQFFESAFLCAVVEGGNCACEFVYDVCEFSVGVKGHVSWSRTWSKFDCGWVVCFEFAICVVDFENVEVVVAEVCDDNESVVGREVCGVWVGFVLSCGVYACSFVLDECA